MLLEIGTNTTNFKHVLKKGDTVIEKIVRCDISQFFLYITFICKNLTTNRR